MRSTHIEMSIIITSACPNKDPVLIDASLNSRTLVPPIALIHEACHRPQVKEEDGSWQVAMLYVHNHTGDVVLWFGEDKFEGLDGGYRRLPAAPHSLR